MSLVLIVSLALRSLALIWSVELCRRLRERKIWWLAAILLSLVVAQSWTLPGEMLAIGQGSASFGWQKPVLDLMVSVFALLYVGAVAGSLRSDFNRHRKSGDRHRDRDKSQFTQFSVDSSSSAIFWVREDASFIYVNKAVSRQFGYSSREMMSMTVHDIDPDYPPAAWPVYWNTIQQERSMTFETQILHKQGHFVPVEITTNVMSYEGEEIVFAFLTVITNRKQVEEALEESEERFKTIFQNAPEAAFLVSAEGEEIGRILMANETAERMHGYGCEELTGMPIGELTSPEDARLVAERIDRLVSGEQLTFELQHFHKDGTTFPLEVIATEVKVNGRRCALGYARDISQRKQLEEAKQESEANLSALIENSMDNILSVDRNYRVLIANSVVRKNSRQLWSADFRPGCNILDQVPQEIADIWKPRFDRALAGERFTLEERYVHGDFAAYYEVSFNPIETSDIVSGVSVFARDISDRRRAENSLRATEERVRLAFDQQFQFMTILSPEGRVLEINNLPLRVQRATREQYIGKLFWKSPAWETNPTWQAIIKSRIDKALSMNGPLLAEDRFQTSDGEVRFADAAYSVIRDKDHGVQFILVQATDITERKQAEKALRESEERWQFALDGSRDGVWDWNVETNRVYFSNRWKEMLGYAVDDVGSDLTEWERRVHPDDKDSRCRDLQKHFDAKTPFYENEHRVLCKDGSWKWILDRGKVITRSDDGQPLRMIGTLTDVTSRRQSEEALRQSEQRFRSLVETAPFGVQRHDVHGRITFANAALGKIYGCPPEDLIGRHVWDFALDEKSREVMKRYVNRQSTSPRKVSSVIETQNRTCDNGIIDVYIDWTFEHGLDRQIIGFIAIITDITKRRESERALEFQADVLNRVSDAVLVTDATGSFTYANAAAKHLARFAGQSRSESMFAALHDELLVSGLGSSAIRECLAKSGVWQGEYEIPIGNSSRSFELKLKEFESPDSQGKFLLLVIRDISARKVADQEIREHRQMLAHVTRLSTMGELVAGIAHEVKQPLHAIANFATATSVTLDHVATDSEDEFLPELREWNIGIRDASRRAGEIIRRLREFSRKGEQKRGAINVNQVIQDSIALVAFEARQCHAFVDTHLANDLPDVDADRIQFEQVLVNLLHNAYEALNHAELPRQVVVRSIQVDEFVEIEVEDNGPGIHPEQGGHLFEAFYTTKPEGMGMGLAISQTIVEDHGGRLWASRNRNRGTTFHFTLPVIGNQHRAGLPK